MTAPATPVRHEAPPASPAPPLTSLTGPRFAMGLGAVLLVQAGVVAVMMSRSFLFFEDFSSLVMFRGEPLSVELLTRSVFGHLAPAFILLNRYVGEYVAADWNGLTAITVLAQLGGTVAFVRLLLALHGRRWWVLWLTGVYALSIVNLNNAPWWGATVIPQIPTALCVSAFGCAVRYGVTGHARHVASFAVMFGAALAFWEKSLILPGYLGLFVLLVGLRPDGRMPARLREVGRLWPVWLVSAVLGVVDLAVYLRGGYIAEAGPSPSATSLVSFLVRGFTEGVLTSLHAFDYPNVSIPGPMWLTIGAVCAVAAAVILATSWRSPRAVRAWVWFLLTYAVGQVLVGRGRLNLMGVDLAAHELRYQVDAVYLALVALSVAAPTAGIVGTHRRLSRIVVLVLPVALLVPWVASVRYLVDHSWGVGSKAYFSQMQADAMPRRYLDVAVPPWVVPPQMYPWNMAGSIYGLVNPRSTVTNDPTGAYTVSYDGRVVPVNLSTVRVIRAGTLCLTPGQTERVNVSGDLSTRSMLVAADYRTTADGSIRVDAEGLRGMGSSTSLTAGAGVPRDGVLTTVALPTADFDTLAVSNAGSASLCLSDLRFVTP